eukprot:TRINITY_DN1712_c1_g1_i1.p2 TRINITY_DN1712_c1_g1~~TRINITY_DN1712_c1_g1_i1.p2  ORF type:complete len:233 (-),score=37.34 TRINITY_DN1712_c1_g1_i1:197-895(-)
MGKGAGQCLRKTVEHPVAEPVAQKTPATMSTKIYIVYYSTWGHVYKMAQSVKEGVDQVEGCEGVLYQIAETLPQEVLDKMHAAPKPADVPVIDPKDLANADGILFGIPTRFGMMAAQVKALFDATGGLWQAGSLLGKPAGIFYSTGTQNGGQETTALTAVTQLTHHGMIFVPTGYGFGAQMFDNSESHGGSPYGAGTLAGADGSQQPKQMELDFAKYQGKYFAEKAKLLAGK